MQKERYLYFTRKLIIKLKKKKMKKMKLLFMFLLVFNLTSAQKKKIVVKPNQIDTKYIGKW
jgi:hypothetical protein